MCGIGGYWGTSVDDRVLTVAQNLGDALRHRGPDDHGWLLAWPDDCRASATRTLSTASGMAPPSLVLAHRRLSIVDVSGGWQPIANESGTVWIVYNGEIYNHLSLRAELERSGHEFRTRSDTEVVVHAYEEWGPEGFARFNGIFAFALWDAPRRRLLLARDSLGVKPLYHGAATRGLWFASEVKAAIAAGLCNPAVHLPALDHYLTYRFVPSPSTLFRGVERLPPGHWVQADASGRLWNRPVRFAPLPASQDRDSSLSEWVDRLTDATQAAVGRQLMADVPVGALLSGGLDSSIIVAVMQSALHKPAATYAVGFSGSEGELVGARRGAAALGSQHHDVEVDRDGFFQAWVETLSQLDEPVSTPGHVLLGLVCRRASQDLKVVLTGQGADEPLGGYLRHSVERWISVLGWPPLASLLRLGTRAAGRSEPLRRLASVANERDLVRRFVTTFAVFTPDQRQMLLRPSARREVDSEAVSEPVRYWLRGTEGLDSLNRLLYLDARLSLADDLLLGGDKVSMAWSVEARVPYLDLEYLAVAERIPSHYKISLHAGRKRMQRLVGRRLLPAPLARQLTAPGSGWGKKRGFDVPLGKWFERELLSTGAEFLTGREATLLQYFDRAALQDLIESHLARRADHTRRLIALLTLEAWHRRFVGGDASALARLSAKGARALV